MPRPQHLGVGAGASRIAGKMMGNDPSDQYRWVTRNDMCGSKNRYVSLEPPFNRR